MIYRLENFPASSGRAHNQQKFDKNPDTLMTIDSKIRSPSMRPDKKSLATYAKKKKLFVIEHHHISAESNRPIQILKIYTL